MTIAAKLPEALRGVTIQPYRAVLPGRTDAAKRASLKAELKRWKGLGCVGFAPHGFTLEMPAKVPGLVEMSQEAGLACLPIFGVDSDDPGGKGERMLGVARVPGVAGIGVDAEGKFEDEERHVEVDNARRMGAPLIRAPESIVVIHQPWPVPQVHMGRYPWLEFAKYCSAWANQDYYGAWKAALGPARFKKMAPEFQRAWARFEREQLAPVGLGGIERITTLEGYGWDDLPYDCVHAFVRSEVVVVWCEPYPTTTVLEALRVRQALDQAVGLYVQLDGRRAWSGHDAVLRFQRAYNQQVGPSKRLVEDGAYGPKTEAALRGGLMNKAVRAVARALGLAA